MQLRVCIQNAIHATAKQKVSGFIQYIWIYTIQKIAVCQQQMVVCGLSIITLFERLMTDRMFSKYLNTLSFYGLKLQVNRTKGGPLKMGREISV